MKIKLFFIELINHIKHGMFININIPTTKKYKYLCEKRNWFKKIYGYKMDENGWDIFLSNKSFTIFFKIDIVFDKKLIVLPYIDHYNKKNIPVITSHKSWEIAKQYGWILNDKGIILDYDDKNIYNTQMAPTLCNIGLL